MDQRRLFLIVLDGVGIGELPDAHLYGDEGAHTLGHVYNSQKPQIPNLLKLGLGNIENSTMPAEANPIGDYGRCVERSLGKDTTTGHWEIAGLLLDKPFPTYPQGFPPQVMDAFEKAIGKGTLGNKPASGTAILDELGEEHLKTGKPIVYTSADSVFQIAAHEDIYPPEKLYEMCRIARKILVGEHAVARVIARPFEGVPGAFKRTPRRHDFSVLPPEPTVLDALVKAGIPVAGVGKIPDIFAHQGVSLPVLVAGNPDCTQETLKLAESDFTGLCFTNLVDTDMLYGHRNDPAGFAKALEAFDMALPRLLAAMKQGDALIITADHGVDPTTDSTDHSREYTPLLYYRAGQTQGKSLGTRDGFYDTAATVAEFFGLPAWKRGKSYL